MDVIVDFKAAPTFPDLRDGEQPKIERLRDQLRTFATSYEAARGRPPERIVLAPDDFDHIARRMGRRVNEAARREWREDHEARKATDPKAKRGPKPEKRQVVGLRWGETEIVQGARYHRHRPVETLK